MSMTSTAPAPRTVTIDLGWIWDDADAVGEQTGRLDTLVEALRDLADRRVPLPEPAALRERLTELASQVEDLSGQVSELAEGIVDRVDEALGDDDEEGPSP